MVSLTYVERKQRIFNARRKKRNKLLNAFAKREQLLLKFILYNFLQKKLKTILGLAEAAI
jgi:hypothetical protein